MIFDIQILLIVSNVIHHPSINIFSGIDYNEFVSFNLDVPFMILGIR